MQEIQTKLQGLRDLHSMRKGELRQIEARLTKLKEDMVELEDKQLVSKEAVLLFEFAGQSAREFITSKFNDIVTFALQSIFGEDYKFTVELKIKRNAVWAEFQVSSAGYKEPADPLLSRGGGVIDIVSMALRIVLLELYTPKIEGPLLLDEPTKQLSKEYSSRAAELLTSISERTKRQIILVTHDQILAKEAEKRFEL